MFCIFCTSTLMAASHVEKLPYNWRQLPSIRLPSIVRIGETSPAVMYEMAPPMAPDISESDMLCWASRSTKQSGYIISLNNHNINFNLLNPIADMGRVTTSAKNPCLAGAPLAIKRTLKIGPVVRNICFSLSDSASTPPMNLDEML